SLAAECRHNRGIVAHDSEPSIADAENKKLTDRTDKIQHLRDMNRYRLVEVSPRTSRGTAAGAAITVAGHCTLETSVWTAVTSVTVWSWRPEGAQFHGGSGRYMCTEQQ
ncbi:MAG: hypothetical protein BJ554DRAFT_7036, partial [Olpidium bornovanus]